MIAIKATARFAFLPVKEKAFAMLVPSDADELKAKTDEAHTDENEVA
mgnify:FL=1